MNAQLLITAGRGPKECHLVVVRVADLLITKGRAAGLAVGGTGSTSPTGSTAAPRKGCPSLLLDVSGAGADRWCATVVGPVQWIAPSPLRPTHARRNWFVEVDVVHRAAPSSGPFDERDVTFQPVRSGGPGGQRRNKVATAVRAQHGPSGRIVVASSERNLSSNRALALSRLAELVAEGEQAHERRHAQQIWQHHDDVTRGNPVRTIRAPLA